MLLIRSSPEKVPIFGEAEGSIDCAWVYSSLHPYGVAHLVQVMSPPGPPAPNSGGPGQTGPKKGLFSSHIGLNGAHF